MGFETTRLFNRAEFSDVTIKFSGYEIKCHKVILCDASEYFKKQFAPNSRFQEGQQSVIELKDDPPQAVKAMIAWLYGFRLAQCCEEKYKDPCLHLDIAVTANKYLLPELEDEAACAFSYQLVNLHDLDVTMKIAEHQARRDLHNEVIDNSVASLMAGSAGQLMGRSKFRELLERDSKLLQCVLDRLAWADSMGP